MGVWEAGMIATDDRLNAGDGAGEANLTVFVASGNLTSGAFVDIPGDGGAATSVTLTKYSSTSKLFVMMKTNLFSTAGSTGVRLGMRINGVEWNVALGYFTTASQYGPVIGWRGDGITGIPAGTYVCQAIWRIYTGAGQITANNNISELNIHVREFGI